jgi:enoyl-CoA hydratase
MFRLRALVSLASTATEVDYQNRCPYCRNETLIGCRQEFANGGDVLSYDQYQGLLFDFPGDGVLLVTINRPEKLNALTERMHFELGQVWRTASEDDQVRVIVITGAGRAFCAGGDHEMERRQLNSFANVANTWRESSELVYNIINCDKPIISAINGPAVGAGLATALLADISLIADNVRLTDGHTRIGLTAGDHAAMLWPLLCGLARAKYYLLTSDFIDAHEAESLGLVSRCVAASDLRGEALRLASRLASGPQYALRWTKRSLNQWLRIVGPIFDSSLSLEMLNLFDKDIVEGLGAFKEHREPLFPSIDRSFSRPSRNDEQR